MQDIAVQIGKKRKLAQSQNSDISLILSLERVLNKAQPLSDFLQTKSDLNVEKN